MTDSNSAQDGEQVWQVVDTVESENGEYEVSTVELMIPHGPNRNQNYETCIFWSDGSYVISRYHTQDEAEDGHERIVSRMEDGAFEEQDSQIASISIEGEP